MAIKYEITLRCNICNDSIDENQMAFSCCGECGCGWTGGELDTATGEAVRQLGKMARTAFEYRKRPSYIESSDDD